MKQTKYKKVIIEHYGSIHQLIDVAMRRPNNKVYASDTKSDSETGSKGFTGTESFAEALEILKNGYTDPLKDIKQELHKAQAVSNTVTQRVRPSTGVVGYAPCVPNAILGLPNSMISSDRVPMKSKTITLLYSPTVSGSVNKRVLIKAGVAVMRIINDLELKGFRVKLDVEIIGTEENKEFASATVSVKDWREHLDLKKLAFPLVHPSTLRRIGFKWLETVPGLTESGFHYGYGTPISVKSNPEKVYQSVGILDDKTYYINPYMCRECDYNIDKIMEISGITKGAN